jgi:RNA polymerase sigma-70 factor (ECF subfamily)
MSAPEQAADRRVDEAGKGGPNAASDPKLEAQFKRELIALIPHLRAFARTLAGDPASADDLAQDAMMKAWDARASYQMGTNMKAWTFMILRNQFYSEKRRSWRQTQLDQEAAERTLIAADDPESPVALDELRLSIGMLPAEQREALILVGAGGFAYEEAAEICGCAVGTVKSRVSRARKALQGILAQGAYDRDGAPAGDAMRSILSDAERLSTVR